MKHVDLKKKKSPTLRSSFIFPKQSCHLYLGAFRELLKQLSNYSAYLFSFLFPRIRMWATHIHTTSTYFCTWHTVDPHNMFVD